MGLRELLGLKPRNVTNRGTDSGQFMSAFQSKLAHINRVLHYTAANADPGWQQKQVTNRDNLIAAYHAALEKLNFGDDELATAKVLAAADKLAMKLAKNKEAARQAADEWENSQSMFDSALAKSAEMEDADLDKSTTMRAILTKIQKHADNKNYKLAKDSLEKLAEGIGLKSVKSSAEQRTTASLPGTPVQAKTNQKDDFGMRELKVDGKNLLIGNGFHIIGGKKANADVAQNQIESMHSKNRDGKMYVGGDAKQGSIPYSLKFDSSDTSALKFSLSAGPSDIEFSTISFPLEARLELFSHYRANTSPEPKRYDDIPRDPNYGGGEGDYHIAHVPGNMEWGEMIGPDYSIRVTIKSSSPPAKLFFVSAPGLSTGVRDVEFSFGAVKPNSTVKATGTVQVFRTDPKLLGGGAPETPSKPPAGKPTVFRAHELAHKVGKPDSGGWSVNVVEKPGDFLCFGPYTRAVSAGQRTARFSLMLDNVTADKLRIVTIDVYDADVKQVLKQRDLHRNDFDQPFAYKDFDISFLAAANNRLEFRTFWHGHSYVRQDKVTVW